MRVTQAMMGSLLTGDLQTIQSALMQTQQQLASGHRILVPSNDPIGTENVLQWQNAMDQNTQYQSDAKNAVDWLQSTQSALQQAVSAGQQVRTLAVSTGGADLTSANYQQIAQQIGSLQSSLTDLANTKVGDHYLFSGDQTSTQPFTQAGSVVTYTGGTGTIMREVGPGVSVQANADGNAAFSPVFQAIEAVLYDLGPTGNPANIATNSGLTGTNPYNAGPGGDLTQLDSALNNLSASLGQVGANLQQVQHAQSQLTDLGNSLQQLQGGILNDNLTASVVRLQELQVNYQSALAVGARLLQPTLANYLP